jgi:hypothetical protein
MTYACAPDPMNIVLAIIREIIVLGRGESAKKKNAREDVTDDNVADILDIYCATHRQATASTRIERQPQCMIHKREMRARGRRK